MRFFKCVGALLLTAVLAVCLCGCGAQMSVVTVNEDGSGIINAMVGWPEEQLDALVEYTKGADDGRDVYQMDKFGYDGKTYYGRVLWEGFQTPSELSFDFLNAAIDELPEPLAQEYSGFGTVQLEMLRDGNMLLLVTIPESTEPDWSALKEEDPALYDLVESLGDDMVKELKFELPGIVQQTGGCFNGVNVDGSTLTLNYAKMADNSCRTYSFIVKSAEEGQLPAVESALFSDTPADAWYAQAVAFMAEKGYVSGYEDGSFGPGDALTIAQFAQILANVQEVELEANGDNWWAEAAVTACIERGWLTDRGEANESNYGGTIRRQEAIAAIQRACDLAAIDGREVKPEDIPDYDDICEKYRNDILAAYDAGLVSGTDEKGTLLPLNTLTRAEVCQLFYRAARLADSGTGSVVLNGTGYSLKVGEKVVLSLSRQMDVEEDKIIWVSSNPNVVTVSRGLVVAVGEGEADITAIAGTYSQGCTIQVTA